MSDSAYNQMVENERLRGRLQQLTGDYRALIAMARAAMRINGALVSANADSIFNVADEINKAFLALPDSVKAEIERHG